MKARFFIRFIAVGLIGLNLSACDSVIIPDDREEQQAKSFYDVNLYPLNKLVCDPFGGTDEEPDFQSGLKADLYYASASSNFKSVNDYITKGQKADKFFFFSQINVPTRLFNLGFPLETGGLVQDDNNTDLVEYFAMRFSTVLKLGPNDQPGTYEFALLSDDGAFLRYRNDAGDYVELVNNDKEHMTRLGCGGRLTLDRDSEVVLQLDYFQGPRQHISLIPIWRRVDDTSATESLCGKNGNSYWFDFNNQSAPQKPYKQLLARGWRPIAAANYQMPQTVAFNPCQEGLTPVLSNFNIEVRGDRVIATWQTNLPTTSQLRYYDIATREESLTESDNVLRTRHQITSPALSSGQYVFQAISISESYGRALSSGITLFIEGL